MYSWLTFYHSSHEVAKDHKPHMTELQSRIQTTRDHFNASREDIRSLMSKMLEVRQSVRLFFEYFFDRELQSLAVLKLKIKTFYMGYKFDEEKVIRVSEKTND